MSERESSDEQQRGPVREGRSGLSLPRDETGGKGRDTRSARGGIHAGLRRAGLGGESGMARWLGPAAVVVILLLLINAFMYFSQGRELAAWQQEIAAIRDRVDTLAGNRPDAEFERMRVSLDRLSSRMDDLQGLGENLEALETRVAARDQELEALSDRLDELEGASTAAPESEASSSGQDAGGPDSATGEWIINLITVSERASAEAVRERLSDMDIESRIDDITRDGRTLYRVAVPGFETRDQARTAAPDLKSRLELPGDPWIAKQ
ncbi:MAG TPA: SPOR domain-containing protein [Arenicellales bacterium]|nr:SPOR domain-containing protein [Arenicellales bacterium]